MNSRIRAKLLPLAIAALIAAAPAMAQNVTSSAVAGRVVDASGHAVAGATVQIVHVPSGTTKIVTTDADGRYTAQGLRVGGPFDITASKAGLSQAEHDNVYLQLAQESAINLTLPASADAKNATNLQAVKVSGSALAQTFSPDNKGISTNISSRELEATPTPDRSIQNIVRLDPRIVVTDRAAGSFSAIGQNSRYNNVTIDSVSANDPFGLNANGLPTLATPISQDTIEEYNISTANYDVANRRGVGATVNAVTKSGTNDFHGSVYYVFQNQNMIGNNENDAAYSGFDRQWTGGATVGGPIIKDKLFFFLSAEKSKQVGSGSPYGPDGSGASVTVKGLTPDQIQQVADIAASKYGIKDIGTYGGGSTDLVDKRYLGKIDWNISDNHRASFTYSRTNESKPTIGGSSTNLVLSSGWYNSVTKNTSYALHFYDDWSDSFSTDTTISYAKFSKNSSPVAGGDLPDITVYPVGYGNPSVEFGTNYSYQANVLDVKTLSAAWAGTYYAGDHTIKGGFDYEKDTTYNLFLQNYFGSYTFEDSKAPDGSTISGLDNFLAGNYYQYRYSRPSNGLGLNDVAANFVLKQWGIFLQDTWQVNDHLSLQYGVRVDIPSIGDKPIYNPLFAAAPVGSSYNPVTQTGTPATGGFGRTNQTTPGGQVVQPRVSFNYNFNTELLTQIRGGAGLFISNPPGVWIGNIFSNSGATQTQFNCGPTQKAPCNTNLPVFSPDAHNQNDGVIGSGQQTVNTLSPGFRLPSVWKFSLGFDKQLPWWGLIATADYEHIKVRDSIFYQNLNVGAPTAKLPDGRFSYYKLPNLDPRAKGQQSRYLSNGAFSDGTINLADSSSGSADSLALSVKKPFSTTWSGMVGLTFSRATEVNPGTSSVARSNYVNNYIYNPNVDSASPSNYSIPRRVIAGLNWQHQFFGNYTTSASMFYDGHNASPYSWTFGNDANGDGVSNDLVYIPKPGDVSFRAGTSAKLIEQFYDYIKTNDYLKYHQGQTAGRNGDRAGWLNQIDLSFSQEIPGIFKGNKGVIKLDVYNFTNLLNKHWGIEKRANFPGSRNLADFYGVDANGKYIYDISCGGAKTCSNYIDGNGNYSPQQVPTSTFPTDLAQRWALQLTVKYRF